MKLQRMLFKCHRGFIDFIMVIILFFLNIVIFREFSLSRHWVKVVGKFRKFNAELRKVCVPTGRRNQKLGIPSFLVLT